MTYVVLITTILMFIERDRLLFSIDPGGRVIYNMRVNRGADQARRWDFYKLYAQVGGKR